MPRTLVTAGNTREMIDRVRDWGNIFTGNTGYAIAKAVAAYGPVELLTSNAAHAAEAASFGITASTFRGHADLRDALRQRMTASEPGHAYDAVFMTAAVADYRPVRSFAVTSRTPNADGTETWVVRDAQAGKVKSDYAHMAVLGERTEKLVDLFRGEWGFRGLLVKFKLEVGLTSEALLNVARASRVASGADYLIANTLDMVDGETAGAFLVSADGHAFVPRGELALRCATLVASI